MPNSNLPEAPQATTNTPDQAQGESIPGLMHPTQQETTTSNAAVNSGAEIPTQAPDTTNAAVDHIEVSTPSTTPQPSEFERKRYAPDPPKAEEIRAGQPAESPKPDDTVTSTGGQPAESSTTPTPAPGLEEAPKPIENPTPQSNEQPPAAAQDAPTQIDATGEIQTPTESASADFAEIPAQASETDNQAANQINQAQAEANAAAAMHIKKAPINLEPEQKLESQNFSEEVETDNTTYATIEEVNTEAARGFAQIKGTHYEEPFLKGYSEAVKEALLHSTKSD